MKISVLIEALKTLPQDADCWVYEGEVSGIIVNEGRGEQKVITCDPDDDQIVIEAC